MNIRQLIKKTKKDTMIALYVNGHCQGRIIGAKRFAKVFPECLSEKNFEISSDKDESGILIINVIKELENENIQS